MECFRGFWGWFPGPPESQKPAPRDSEIYPQMFIHDAACGASCYGDRTFMSACTMYASHEHMCAQPYTHVHANCMSGNRITEGGAAQRFTCRVTPHGPASWHSSSPLHRGVPLAGSSSPCRRASAEAASRQSPRLPRAANLRTKILDFRGFYSSGVLISRG